MEYSLVIQFRGDSIGDLDAAIEFEKELAKALDRNSDVDEHDVGSGEINIFIFTSDPATAFALSKPILERRKLINSVTVAFREVAGEEYTVIWPKNFGGKFSIA